MRYRALTGSGDFQFGGGAIFHTDTSAAVAQAIKTRLGLWVGEWFLDSAEGTPYHEQILGAGTQSTRDLAIRSRVLDTLGVLEILEYTSHLTPQRSLVVSVTVATIYGTTSLTAEL